MPPLHGVAILVVHVLGSTVGLAGQKTFLDADPQKKAVDRESHQDGYNDVDPTTGWPHSALNAAAYCASVRSVPARHHEDPVYGLPY
jgi:hypothetical protein